MEPTSDQQQQLFTESLVEDEAESAAIINPNNTQHFANPDLQDAVAAAAGVFFLPPSSPLLEPDNQSAATASSVLIDVMNTTESLPGDVSAMSNTDNGEGGNENQEMGSGSGELDRRPSASSVIRLPPISYNGSGRFTVQVVGSETHFGEDGDHTVYELEVKDKETGMTSIVFRRYTEFLVFYTKLVAKYPELMTEVKFPPKKWFGNNADKVIRERMAGFNAIIQHICMDERYYNDPNFHDFIKSDMVMLKKALKFFRTRLYAYRQQKLENQNKEAVRRTEMKIKLLDQSLKRATDQMCSSVTTRVRSRTVHTTRTARPHTDNAQPHPQQPNEI